MLIDPFERTWSSRLNVDVRVDGRFREFHDSATRTLTLALEPMGEP